jgi:hypothetical protein
MMKVKLFSHTISILLLFVVALLTLGYGYNDKDCSGDINVD